VAVPGGRSRVAVPLAVPALPIDGADWIPADDVADRERVDVAFLGTDRERPAPPDARVPVDRLDDDDPPDLEAELLVVLFFPVLLLAELFLLVLFLPVVLRLERVVAVFLFAVPLLELLFAGLLFAEPLLELFFAGLLLAELFLLVLFLPVLRLELLFAVLFLPVLLELLLAVFLLELFLAVLLLPVLLLLAPERFFAPLRFRDEPPRPPFDSASMSSSFRIREAPAIPARVARLRSSATVMSSMLRATSAPSPNRPLDLCSCYPSDPAANHPAERRTPDDARQRPRATLAVAAAFAWSRLHREGTARRRDRGADRRGRGSGAFGRRSRGNEPLVGDGARDPGELAEEKRGESSDPGHPQPSAAEVESARLLENAAAERLGAEGVGRDEVRRLADEYVALDLGEDTDGFLRWARNRIGN
jgi:hypothetical protein